MFCNGFINCLSNIVNMQILIVTICPLTINILFEITFTMNNIRHYLLK